MYGKFCESESAHGLVVLKWKDFLTKLTFSLKIFSTGYMQFLVYHWCLTRN